MYTSAMEHDPNLTLRGLTQATEAGLHFKNCIDEVQAKYGITFDEVKIETSPFVRCLQTASKIAKVLDKDQIHVNYRVCEVLYECTFDEAAALDGGIFQNLEMKTKGPTILAQTALHGVQILDTSDWYNDAKAIYPETDEALTERYNIVANYYKNAPVTTGKSTCIIVVTHAAFPYNLPERFNAKNETELGLTYCSSFQALIKIDKNDSQRRDTPIVIEELNDRFIRTR